MIIYRILKIGRFWVNLLIIGGLVWGQNGFTSFIGQHPIPTDRPQTAPPETGEPTEISKTSPPAQSPEEVYGFNLFDYVPSQGDELGAQVLPVDYVLGPGDRLGIYLLGTEPLQFDVIVNVEGKIFVPSVGVFSVAGMTLNGFKKVLHQKLANYYSNYHIDLMLLSPKYIRVAVVGNVEKPGTYSVSALTSVLDVVVKAGGPTKRGSLRNIQLFRQGKLVAYYDLYKFLMQGEIRQQILLQTDDRIYVPCMEAKVRVSGEVRHPALFELQTNQPEYFEDVIEFAGGFTEFAYLDRIEISHLLPDGNRRLSYYNYHEISADSMNRGPRINNQDWIHIYSILEQRHQAVVSIYGEIKNPGKYEWQQNLRVSDLLLMAGNITRSAYTLQAEVARVDPLAPANVIKIDLAQILENHDSDQNVLLEEDDVVYIRKIPEWEVELEVEVTGEVKFPGIYSISRDSTYLSQIIAQCNGFTKDAMLREATVVRKSTKVFIDKEYERLKTMSRDEMSDSEYQYFVMKQNMRDVGQVLVDFHKLFIENDRSEDIILKNGDIIHIPQKPKVVQVTGRVSRPGGVLYRNGMKLKYYLKKAGGATWDSDVKNTKVTKVSGEIVDYDEVDELVAGDIIWVPRKPHRDWWAIFRDIIAVSAQLATVILLIQNVGN